MSDVLHVNTDLVRPPRFQLAFHQGHRSQALQHAVMRHGVFAFAAILKHLLNATIAEGSTHMARDGAILADVSPNQRPVTAIHCALKKLLAQVGQRPFRLAQHHEASGVLVQAVHQPWPRLGLIGKAGHVLEVMQDAIHQRTRVIPMAGVHHQIHRLVEHQQVVVLIEDVQIHGLRKQFKLIHRLRQLHRDHILGLHLVVALDRLAIDPHVA